MLTQSHTHTHTERHSQALLHPSIATQRHTFTHAPVYNIRTVKGEHQQEHNHTHACTPRTTTDTEAHTKTCSGTFTHHSCTQARPLEYSLQRHTLILHTVLYTGSFRHTHTQPPAPASLTKPCRHPQLCSL
uniref:Uncharacterized protein n=1 Tax=Pipistrellus kuhlii TaxID=59472 RepID=A0A7J8A941_PIPKU|nr:hypothetical protein mPipKuh1_009030 [Pipistrellus kuhlii]